MNDAADEAADAPIPGDEEYVPMGRTRYYAFGECTEDGCSEIFKEPTRAHVVRAIPDHYFETGHRDVEISERVEYVPTKAEREAVEGPTGEEASE